MVEFKSCCQDIPEKEYRADPRPSYSFFKELEEKGPSVIMEGIPEKRSPSLTLGSIVDKYLTGEDYDVNEEYTISNVSPDLSGRTHHSKILKYIFDNNLINIQDSDLKDICKKLNFKKSPNLKDKFFEVQLNMVKAMLRGKKYISPDELELAQTMVATLKSHEYTRDIFRESYDENIEIVKQAIIFFTIRGVEVKGMLDIVIVDHKNKVIYPKDLKTGTFFNFMENFYKYKYYLQAAMYTIAVYYIRETVPYFKDFEVAPFEFIYISRENPELPLIYKMPNKFIEMAAEGWITRTGKEYKGILEIVDDYKWYLENEEFILPRHIAENNGVIEIQTPLT